MKVISNSEFKQQLQNTSDIVRKLEMAPRTKEAMNRLKYSGVGRSFTHPGKIFCFIYFRYTSSSYAKNTYLLMHYS